MFQQTGNENKEKTLTKTDLGRVWIGWLVTPYLEKHEGGAKKLKYENNCEYH